MLFIKTWRIIDLLGLELLGLVMGIVKGFASFCTNGGFVACENMTWFQPSWGCGESPRCVEACPV